MDIKSSKFSLDSLKQVYKSAQAIDHYLQGAPDNAGWRWVSLCETIKDTIVVLQNRDNGAQDPLQNFDRWLLAMFDFQLANRLLNVIRCWRIVDIEVRQDGFLVLLLGQIADIFIEGLDECR